MMDDRPKYCYMNKAAMGLVLFLITSFLMKIRYPGGSLHDVILNKYGRQTLKTYRGVEREHFRMNKIQMDITFLNTCLAFKVVPKFVKFKVHNRTFENSPTYRNWQNHLVNCELKRQKKKLEQLKIKFNDTKYHLKSLVSFLDFWIFYGRIIGNTRNSCISIKQRHSKKLQDLGVGPIIWNTECIFNLSDRILTVREKELLSLGLNFCIPFYKTNNARHELGIDKLCNVITDCAGNGLLRGGRLIGETLDKVRSLGKFCFNSAKRLKSDIASPVFKLEDIDILNNLKDDTSIIITRPDKGRGVVILNKVDYITKMKSILSDRTKFKEVTGSLFTQIIKLEDKLNRILRSIKDNIGLINFNYLYASGTSPGIMYGLPKIHKNNIPFRPIISTINTTAYKLGKFLLPLLTPFTTNEYTVSNSKEFVDELLNVNLPKDFVMASFDIDSLFTNVPLLETIRIILDKVNEGEFYGLTKNILGDLLKFATSESLFLFDNVMYNQIDGISMGSRLGPVFAATFLCHNEVL